MDAQRFMSHVSKQPTGCWHTQSQNITQCAQRGRLVDNAGEKHGCARLTADQVISIRASTETHAAAGRSFGVNEATIRAIRQRKLWKHL